MLQKNYYTKGACLNIKQTSVVYCQNDHAIYKCQKFLHLSAKERSENARKLSLYANCFLQNHKTDECHLGPRHKCGKNIILFYILKRKILRLLIHQPRVKHLYTC